MKFQNLLSFSKHLKEAAPNNLSCVYLVALSAEYERRQIVAKIKEAYIKSHPDLSVSVYEAGVDSIESVLSALNTASLFGGKSLILFCGVDKLKKEALGQLSSYLESPSPFSFLILGASSLKGLSDLCLKGKKELIICDLSEEKPWEREKRIKEWLLEKAKNEGKILEPSCMNFLLEASSDYALLEQELLKLIAFVGERKSLSVKDASLICCSHSSATGWQLAESIVWSDDKIKPVSELATLLPLIGQVRYQLEIGLQLAQRDADVSHLRSTIVDKFQSVAIKRGSQFFSEAIHALFALELSCKNSSFDPSFLFSHFILKLSYLKNKRPCLPSYSCQIC